MARDEKIQISISRSLYEKAKEFIEKEGGFNSVEELIEFLLQEAISTEEDIQLPKEDEEKIKERLRSLGYL